MTKDKKETAEEQHENAAKQYIKLMTQKNIGYTTIVFVFLTALMSILYVAGVVDFGWAYVPLLLYAILEVCMVCCLTVILIGLVIAIFVIIALGD